MALNQVQLVQPNAIQRRKTVKGGGSTGQMIGMAIGGAAGAATGNPAAAISGASAGASLGGMVGEKIKPTREVTTGGAMQRRASNAPVQQPAGQETEKLKMALTEMANQPPDVQKEYTKPLVDAYLMSATQQRTV